MASRLRSFLSALGKLGTVALILIAFAFGLAATVYLSLHSPEVQVPDLSGKTYAEGQAALETAGLTLRERARRYKSGTNPGVILDQSPRGGEVVKKGQTIAVVVSRAPKEGESVESAEVPEEKPQEAGGKEGGATNENENRERRRPRNANSNSNANRNANNSNTGNSNSSANQNGGRNANNRNTNNRNTGNVNNRNTNAGANRNRNTSPAPQRNANQTRPNANRRPQQ